MCSHCSPTTNLKLATQATKLEHISQRAQQEVVFRRMNMIKTGKKVVAGR
jgi:hypothetical protein